MTDFYQSPPRLGNQFDDDRALRSVLARLLPPDVHAAVAPGLARLGARVVGDIGRLGDAAEASPPVHVPWDAWGRRVDDIVTSDAWRALDRVSAEEGIVAAAYERRHGEWSRVEQLTRLYLFHPSSATYSCPLAMTDGAARCLELHGGDDAVLRDALAHLTSRDPDAFWTSGQWMTERTGGSDVSGTSTVARCDAEGTWRLHGTKWFTSATTSQMAMTLARIHDDAESSGLSLFQVRLRDGAGALQGIEVHRLKDKLGTRALPTAELTLHGTPATLVGGSGNGVRKVAAMLNVTRVYNACCAVAGMRRAVALASDYATGRVAFGRTLAEHPLHVETLAAMQLEVEGALQLVFHVGALLGREECGVATDAERALLRLLTPVAKLYTGKQAVAVASEALEAFGGAGYIEDTGLPRLLRDAQVLSIWEGTTNVLSLDVLRALERADAIGAWRADIERRLATVRLPGLLPALDPVRAATGYVAQYVSALATGDAAAQGGARSLAFAIARTTIGALLLEQAQWSDNQPASEQMRALAAARRWCDRDLAPLVSVNAEHLGQSRAMLW
ncbi:MAG: acyl-CoA dehydrogenase protein [Gemmatimonadetes bacterium]|nr:acyl-CoA dehydrogenase protein [Gemmatimonadota bacterium]